MESLLSSLSTPLLSDVRNFRNSDHAKQVVSHSTPRKYLPQLACVRGGKKASGRGERASCGEEMRKGGR